MSVFREFSFLEGRIENEYKKYMASVYEASMRVRLAHKSFERELRTIAQEAKRLDAEAEMLDTLKTHGTLVSTSLKSTFSKQLNIHAGIDAPIDELLVYCSTAQKHMQTSMALVSVYHKPLYMNAIHTFASIHRVQSRTKTYLPECLYCTQPLRNNTVAFIQRSCTNTCSGAHCTCKEISACAACFVEHMCLSTQCGRKSTSNCPTCKAQVCIEDIRISDVT